MNHLSSNIILKWDHHHSLEYSLEGGEKNGIPPSTMFLVQMVPFGYGAIVGRWRESMKRGDILSMNQIKPGILVVHHYTPEIAMVLRVNWNEVEVLIGGSIVRWGMDGFRSTYRNIQ